MITKRVVVHTDDPEQPAFPLIMKGTLLVDVVAVPRGVTIRDLKVGEAGTGMFELQLGEDSTAEIVSVTLADDSNFTLTRLPDNAPGLEPAATLATAEGTVPGDAAEGGTAAAGSPAAKGRSLGKYEVRFKGRKDIGTTATKIIVKTTGPNTPELTVSVHASAAANLRYLKTLRFVRKNGKLMERQIHISARHGKVPTIKKVVDPDGLLDFEILETKGKLASIRVAVNPDKWAALDPAEKTTSHDLIVYTTDREEPKLELHYSIAPKSKAGEPKRQTAKLIDPR